MPHERLRPDYTFDEERLTALREIAPEAFADGKINWAALKEALGGELEDDETNEEHFGLFWPGKREARKLASRPSSGTLVPVKGEGINEENTRNIFIEGENLEVLKILRKSYAGRVKMIYIDPPYNTGNDFVYDDDFTEPLQDYLKRTGQIDGEGRPMTTNKKADGRFHSRWLSMMYPRLRLARELLRDDGVIFVSIDDNEVHHLRMLMNEVFGEENFLSTFIWEKRTNRENRKVVSTRHDYIACFSKANNHGTRELSQLPMTEQALSQYKNPDNDSRGRWKSDPASAQAGHGTKSQFYELTAPNGKVHHLESGRCWVYTKSVMDKAIQEGRIWFGKDGNGVPRIKTYLFEKERGLTPETIWFAREVSTTERAKNALKELFDGKAVFETPKPIDLVRRCVELAGEEGIVLDFFAGSAVAGHAVLEQSLIDGKKRSFILVQMAESADDNSEAKQSGFDTVADIAIARLKRLISHHLEQKDLLKKDVDLGIRVLRLSNSHYKPWQNYHGESVEELESLFESYTEPLVENWREIEDGLFTEILLLEGFPLDSTVAEMTEYTANRLRLVTCDFHESRLILCLDDALSPETVQQLNLTDGDTFVCLDTAVDDKTKARLADKGLIKTI
jgi:adenine-specific DNA-methyltransferase